MDTEADMKPEIPHCQIEIVEATLDDIPGIVQVQKTSWRDTYPDEKTGVSRELIEDYTEGFDSPERIERRRRNWQPGRSWVAKDGERIVGFIYFTPKDNEINALYVHPEYLNGSERRLDIGKKLAEEAIKHLNTSREMMIWVVTYNKRAIRFYEKMGFVMTEATKHHEVVGQEVKMVRPASD